MPARLIPRTRDEVRAAIDAMSPATRALVSTDWLALLDNSSQRDPWVHGFHVVDGAGQFVGIGSFKGPPRDGTVEIAYAIVPEQQRKGYATAAARALVEYAFASRQVRTVCAHTLPDGVASQRALQKAGFRNVGEVMNPEDGLVWRFEIVSAANPYIR
jgi:[ribosomal protein S5]-alanine N-acetyltransferase